MSSDQSRIIESLVEFLAHALELEEASVEHYEELADSMEIHNNPQVAELFRRMAGFSQEHANQVRVRAEGLELPEISPWEFKWTCPGSPESSCMEEAHYLMNTAQAMQIALFNEIRGRDFYLQVAETSPDANVRWQAQEMVEEEAWHVKMLEEWLQEVEVETPLEDLDPPNSPE